MRLIPKLSIIENDHYFNEINNTNFLFTVFDENQIEPLISSQKMLNNLTLIPEQFNGNFDDYNENKESLLFKEKEKVNAYRCSSHESQNVSSLKQSVAESSLGYRNNTIFSLMQSNKLEDSLDAKKMKFIAHYKRILEIIDKHLKDSNHPLFKIKSAFFDLFFSYTSNLFENGKKKNLDEKTLNKAIFDCSIFNLKKFILCFEGLICNFYKLYQFQSLLKDYVFFTKENLLNFTTSILFLDKDVFDFLFQIKLKLNKNIENLIEANLAKCLNWKINDFGVPKKFSCNQNTLLYFQKTKDKFKNTQTILENSKISYSSTESPLKFLQPITPKNSVENNKRTISHESYKLIHQNLNKFNMNKNYGVLGKKTMERSISFYASKKSKNIKNDLNHKDFQPFAQAIENLNKFDKDNSPIQKLKKIIKASLAMMEAIRIFYEENGMNFKSSIESDHILSIFLYITSRCKIKYLLSKCDLVDSFLTTNISNSVSGYYLVTLKACLSYFSEENPQKLRKDKFLQFRSMTCFN